MSRNRCLDHKAQQRGAALIIFALISTIAVLGLLLGRLTSLTNASGKRATSLALTQAKDAIIGWSAAHSTKPGMLPCPENANLIGNPSSEGNAQMDCSNLSLSIGRLPWRTLKVKQLLDDAGEPLWYALSPGFRSPSTINGSSPGKITVDGSLNRVVAVIFAPGSPLNAQSRPLPTSATPPDVEQYLEGYDLKGDGSFAASGSQSAFNDRLLTITREDLFRAVNRRVLAELRGDESTGLIKYYADHGAFPPTGSDLPTIFSSLLTTNAVTFMSNNNWYSLLSYSVSPDQQQATLTINAPSPVTCAILPGRSTCN